MGGHLLHIWNLPEKRVRRADFDRIMADVLLRMRNCLSARRIEPLKFFTDKESFGDLDIAMEVYPDDYINFLDFFGDMFGKRPHKNGNCISFPVEGFQVDILLFSPEVFDIAQIYYAYESGNFMGRIADKMGLSYGHRGLYLQVPLNFFRWDLPDHEYREVLVSRDPKWIFTILGFNLERFERGFNNFQEMAEWVAQSKYFAPELFSFDNLNSINRTRNRKRPVYAQFVSWCDTQPANRALLAKDQMRANLIVCFPQVGRDIMDLRASIILDDERRKKFNGNIIKDLRGIENKELGAFIVAFKAEHENFNKYLDDNAAEKIKQDIIVQV